MSTSLPPVLQRRHTMAHDKDAQGRSEVIEGYIAQSVEYAYASLLEDARFLLSSASATALDMGCDNGYALHHLNLHHNFSRAHLVGVDPYYTHNHWNMDLRRLAMDDPALPGLLGGRMFDLIILNHALEHVSNPYIVMQNVHRLLRTNGVVFIAVPHANSEWAQWDGHYSIWTTEWLKRFMRINGFDVLRNCEQEFRPGCVEVWGTFSKGGV